jgi:RNA polymerase sigma-70 factor (ECF subfamily)
MSGPVNINVEDSELLQRFRNGDYAALERLVLKYQNRIYNAVLRICENADDAAELTQDTFVKVIENIERFEGRSSFYTWVFRIAVNLTLNYCKRSVRLGLRSLDEGLEGSTEPLRHFWADRDIPGPETVASDRELCELAKKALGRLDEDHRAVLVLRDMEGMSYAEIAEILEVELGTVKSRLARARSRLREILEAMIE